MIDCHPNIQSVEHICLLMFVGIANENSSS